MPVASFPGLGGPPYKLPRFTPLEGGNAAMYSTESAPENHLKAAADPEYDGMSNDRQTSLTFSGASPFLV